MDRGVLPPGPLVIDRFHVVRALNQCLGACRKALRREQPRLAVFKHLKWVLFKHHHHLCQQDKEPLGQAFAHSPALEQMVSLRARFQHILGPARGTQWTVEQLDHWLEDARLMQIPYLEPFLSTLQNWKLYIANFTDKLTTNALTGGLNNLIRYVKPISFGIPNFEHLRWRVLVNSG